MQEIDQQASQDHGIPSIVLMENAGRGAAEEIVKTVKKLKHPQVVFICGTGNNGGDGFVTARHLMIHDIRPTVFVLGQEDQLKGDALVNYDILKKMECLPSFIRPSSKELRKADCVVDAIFGIGLNRDVTGIFREVIEDINRYAKKIFALDIPSGLNATTGEIHGACIKADKTITFHLPKTGMFRAEGLKYTGKIVVKNIGIDVSLMANSL
jgi:NAD(P)H-hydrate epimerase